MKNLLSIILLLTIAVSSVSAQGYSKSQLFNSIINIIDKHGTSGLSHPYEIQDKNSTKMRVEFKEYIKDAFILGSHYKHYTLDFNKLESVKLEIEESGDSYQVRLSFKKEIKVKRVKRNKEDKDWDKDDKNYNFYIYFDREQDAKRLIGQAKQLKQKL